MRILFTIGFIFLTLLLVAQSVQLKYSRCAISLTQASISDIAQQGIDITHGKYVPGKVFISDFSNLEIDRLKAEGIQVEILIQDVQEHYIQQSAQDRVVLSCQKKAFDYYLPEHFTYGSMGGYYTYQELLDILDAMAVEYPLLITVKQQAGNTLTERGNKVFWIKISDNPDVEEAEEPEVLYTALHHAREPMSLSQMIYYMWYLLERYDIDPQVKYIVDNTQLYFMPCLNPDGYLYNEETNPDGGGMWRKNMKDNDGDDLFDPAVDGVDINRNYGYKWGNDNDGSSPNPGSSTYRGDTLFSEAETQAIRDFCNAHDFKIALNYHAYGNFLIYPWGFSSQHTKDSSIYKNFGEALVRDSDHESGTGIQTLGYVVNGDATDWMYGEDVSKLPYLAFTSELGHSDHGFWPPQDQIIPISQAALIQNLTTPELLLNFAVNVEVSQTFVSDFISELVFDVKRFGLKDGPFTLTVIPLTENIEEVDVPRQVNLDLFESKRVPITYILDPSITHGEEFSFEVEISNGNYSKKQTIRKMFGAQGTPFSENGNNLESWTSLETWGVTTEDYVSAPGSITDSPDGSYGKNVSSILELEEPVDLNHVEEANLTFWAKWDIEDFFDYVLVQGSPDGELYQNLCGNYSDVGSIFQLDGEPLYDDLQNEWVFEEIDLSDYIGGQVYLRFVFISEGFNERDGFYFDDLQVRTFTQTTTSTQNFESRDFNFKLLPNPASSKIEVTYTLPEDISGHTEFRLSTLLGETMKTISLPPNTLKHHLNIDVSGIPRGMYLGSLFVNGNPVVTLKQSIN